MARQWPTRRSLVIGLISLGLSNILLMVNMFANSVVIFIISLLITALGHGLCLISGMAIVNKIAHPNQRAALISTYLITGYLGAIVPILGVGWIADAFGMTSALIAFCTAIGGLAFALSYMAKRCPAIVSPEASQGDQ